MESDKLALKNLILDAERLMATARTEAKELVSSAETQAKELVAAARHLYAAAEDEAQTIHREAAAIRAAAEREARDLSDEARRKHVAAIEQARSIAGPATADEPGETTSGDGDDAEAAIRDASRRVDQMLRVARSEAKANADELLERARRRAAQIDEDARRREEVAAKQHRAMLHNMRDEQLAIRTRIAELRGELRAAEAAAALDAGDNPPTAVTESTESAREASPRDRAPVESEPSPLDNTPPPPPHEPSVAMPMRPLMAPAGSHRSGQPSPVNETDDDYTKAVRRFRRRA